MSQSASQQYKDAYQSYSDAIEEYKKGASDAHNQAYETAKATTGEEGYKKSLDLAKTGARAAAQGAVANAQQAARQAGMTRAQAATVGASQASNAYGNALAEQQGRAYGAGTDLSAAAQTRAGAQAETLGNTGSMKGNRLQTAQAERQNAWNRAWGGIGALGSAISSDEKAKVAIPLSRGTGYAPTSEMVEYLKSNGLARGKDNSEFDALQLATGVLVEMEHSPDFEVALEIAKDHLVEDSEYYSRPMFQRQAIKKIDKLKIDLSKFKEAT